MKKGLFLLAFLYAFGVSHGQSQTPGDTTTMKAYIDSILNSNRGVIRREYHIDILKWMTRYVDSLDRATSGGGGDVTSEILGDTATAIRADIPTNNNQLTNGAGYRTDAQVKSVVNDTADLIRVKSRVLPSSVLNDASTPRLSEVEKYVSDNSIDENTSIYYQPPIQDYRQRNLIYGYDDSYYAFPLLAKNNGYIYTYFRHGDKHTENGDAVLARSADGGLSWDSTVVYDWTGATNEYGAASGGLLFRGDTIFATYRICNLIAPGSASIDTCGNFYRYTLDFNTWSTPVYVSAPPTEYAILGEIEFPTDKQGRTYVPVFGSSNEDGSNGNAWVGYMDAGQHFEDITWVVMADSSTIVENEVDVVLDGDTAIAFTRTARYNEIKRSVSVDRGVTWSAAERVPTFTTMFPAYPKTEILPDGRYIQYVRIDSTALSLGYMLSSDKGRTWTGPIRIHSPEDDSDGQGMYMDFTMLTPTTLGVVYSVEYAVASPPEAGSNLRFTTLSVPSVQEFLTTKSGVELVSGSGGGFSNGKEKLTENQIAYGNRANQITSSPNLTYTGDVPLLGGAFDVELDQSYKMGGLPIISGTNDGTYIRDLAFGHYATPTGANSLSIGPYSGNGGAGIRTAYGGWGAGMNTDDDYNDSWGYQALWGNSGAYAGGDGYQALYLNSGIYVRGNGFQSGRLNTGSYCGFDGYQIGRNNTLDGVWLWGHGIVADYARQIKLGIDENTPAYATRGIKINKLHIETETTPATGDIMVFKDTAYIPSDTLSHYILKPVIDQQTISRDIIASDIFNFIEVTDTITLTITAGFTAMEVGNTIGLLNANNDATVLTIQAASGVTLNGNSAGSVTITGPFNGKTLVKSAANTYMIY